MERMGDTVWATVRVCLCTVNGYKFTWVLVFFHSLFGDFLHLF